jgi:predicted Zn-dependent protease
MLLRRLPVVVLVSLLAWIGPAGAQPRPTIDPRAEEVHRMLEQLVRGEHEEVIRASDAFLARHGVDAETFGVLLLKAQGQRQLGRAAEAIASYERALPFIERMHNVGQRRYVVVYFRLATLYRAQRRLDEAVRYVEAGLAREPQSAYHQILLGTLLSERGERERALRHLEGVLDSATPNPEERAVLRLKIDRLRGGVAPAAPFQLPSARRHAGLSIGLVALNAPPSTVSAADLCLLLESKWLMRCEVLPSIQVDEATLLDRERGQYHGDRVLEELARRYPASTRPHRHVVALIARDLFGPDTNYVFSWQAPQAGLGVLSTYRFTAGLEDFYEPQVVATRRVGIQLLSTSGSLLGFTRPTRPDCPLAYPNDFREFLLKGSRLCESTIEQREALLRKSGGPATPFDARTLAEIQRVYATYAFD